MRLIATMTVSGLAVLGWGVALSNPAANAATAKSHAPRPSVVMSGNLGPVGEGRRNFLKWNCYGCHGMNAAGGIGPNIQTKGSPEVREAMRNGRPGGMPSFVQIAGVADMDNVAAYLASIGTPGEPKWVDWWIDVPPK